MSLRKCLLFVLLAIFFRLVGNQAEHGQPVQRVQVKVKVGDTAVLPCNVSAHMNGETEDNLYIRWVTNDLSSNYVCEFTKGKSHPHDDYRNRTEISKEKNSKHLYHLIINKTRLSDEGEYHCKLGKPGKPGEDAASVQLIVQGREENVSVVFGETLAIRLPVTGNARVRFAPASSSTEADVCTVRQNTLTPANAYASRAALENNALRLDRVTFADEGSYSVIDVATGRVMKTAVLAVEGLVKNRELHEGENLSIPLCCLSSPYIEFCGPAGNSTADGVCQGHVERLTVQNGSLTLSNFTAKDKGKYIVREKMGGVVLTLTLTLKTKAIPVGTQRTDRRLIVGVIAGILPLILVVISVYAYKWCTKRKMERETRRRAEQTEEQFPLSEIKSFADVEEK
ncbi:uncharacterized protein LOC135241247 [Anguilla rostrata]|uniref:uncharacterized protein LOC135241247 n=1 Tax=Anguilla rostrata TaxID=7938 RepID=UPI0030CAE063